jgi:hypothetical protein
VKTVAAPSTQDSSSKERSKERASSSGPMAHTTKAPFQMGSFKGTANTTLQMLTSTMMENSAWAPLRERVSKPGTMGDATRVTSRPARRMEMAHSYGRMAASTSGHGGMISSMVLEYSAMQPPSATVSG